MKALTIHNPWAWLIAEGIKPIENREWTTTHRGTIAIHAGRSVDGDALWDHRVRAALADWCEPDHHGRTS